jgi:predicted TIM-barrel fold metal-dependent hydrolase
MPVIDVDCHFDIPLTRDNHPLAKFRDRFPTANQFLADAGTGDLLRNTPAESRPPEEILALFLPEENRSSGEQATEPGAHEPRFPLLTLETRLAWFDKIGIDHAFLNPGGYGFLCSWLGPDAGEAARRCNDFLADQLGEHTDRLIPVSLIDWHDLDAAVAELQRMRARGSRAYWLRAEAFNGMSPAHPDWDRVWSATTDLGMVPILHVGNAEARFDGGWGNAGWELEGGAGLGGFFRFANSIRHHSAELMLAAMIYGGVFGRNPKLTVLTEELGVAWLPAFIARCDSLSHPAMPWSWEQTPGEMVRRNVRSTPLPGLGDGNVLEGLIHELPQTLVFSSDYPHGEGNADPIALYEPALSSIDPALRASFLGDNMADVFARMGDPLARAH